MEDPCRGAVYLTVLCGHIPTLFPYFWCSAIPTSCMFFLLAQYMDNIGYISEEYRTQLYTEHSEYHNATGTCINIHQIHRIHCSIYKLTHSLQQRA